MIKFIRKSVNNKSGMGKVLACVMVLILLIIFLVVCENARNYMTVVGCRNAVESLATSIANNNYNETYRCRRNGYSGAYAIDDKKDSWSEDIEQRDIYEFLEGSLGAKKQGNSVVKNTSDGKTEFILSDIKVKVENPGFAPDKDKRNENTFIVEVTAKLEVYPMFKIFNNDDVIKMNIGSKSGYVPKY